MSDIQHDVRGATIAYYDPEFDRCFHYDGPVEQMANEALSLIAMYPDLILWDEDVMALDNADYYGDYQRALVALIDQVY